MCNDRCDQLPVADCLSWIGHSSPELTIYATGASRLARLSLAAGPTQ